MSQAVVHPRATPGPRQRLLDAAIALVQEKGVEGAGLSDLLERSSSARRSLYQHFPGGKDELIAESTRQAGRITSELLHELVGSVDAATLFDVMVATLRQSLVKSDYRTSCPIAAAAYAPADSEVVRDAAGAAFADWIGAATDVLTADGRPEAEARALASFMVAAIEGALVLARAARSTQPLDDAAAQLAVLLQRGS